MLNKNLLSLLAAICMLANVDAALAASNLLDDARLKSCSSSGGYIELREAPNGDLSLKLDGLNTSRCNTLKFFDARSGRTIKSYNINGTSYTLSKKQSGELSADCELGVNLRGPSGNETYYVVLGWCAPKRGGKKGSNGYTYELSNSGNCKLMINGTFSEKLVEKEFCGSSKSDSISYERSNKGNCKIMNHGEFTQQLADDYYCNVRH